VLATVDVLSGGRLIVGCGAGWLREEFEAIGAPDFDRRGAVTNEYIRAFKELWTSDAPTFEGEFCSFSNLHFEPKPVQKPHPPIWTGGESPAALRRAGRLADKWFPIGTNPTYPVRTSRQLAESLERVRVFAEEAGRDPSKVGVAYSAGMPSLGEGQPEGGRRPFTGDGEQVAEDIRGFAEVGVDDMTFRFERRTLDETLEAMQQFAEEVMAKV
ncbi:MAG: TIGR03619 family F420-dependent LLM class oxidoreductase, partial [Chloroflexota bacterium]|nr:TIGR03619 family F420-dependent LLM class oxidoreductase [Chloroflexota bacterium]